MKTSYDWEGPVTPNSEKEDVVRATFAAKGWTRDSFGNMNKGDLRISFVFNKVKLKKSIDGRWVTLKTSELEHLYRKVL